jgi:very-long-chain enoyl-CoA reductase
MSQVQTLTMWMFVLHYVKRELETLFVHKFSNSTMPFFNVFRNSAHYWFTSGLFTAYFIYGPNARAAQPLADQFTRNCVFWGMILYVYGEVMNLYIHVVLSKLRSRGGTERAIPRGFGFAWFTSPVSFIQLS